MTDISFLPAAPSTGGWSDGFKYIQIQIPPSTLMAQRPQHHFSVIHCREIHSPACPCCQEYGDHILLASRIQIKE